MMNKIYVLYLYCVYRVF